METKPQNGKPKSSPLSKSQKVLGIQFAPIHTPLERRLQTIGVALWLLICSVIPFGVLIFLVLLYFNLSLGLLYLAWIFWDRDIRNTGGRRIEYVRKWRIWNYYRDYFPLKLVKTVDLDPKTNYLFCAHPHGIFCVGPFGSFATEALGFEDKFPKMTPHLLTVDKSFWAPFTREFLLTMGALPATKESMNYLLTHPEGGKVAVLLPGGVPEQLESRPNTDLVKLKSRKGFIKLALQNGSPIVPVYSFGENDIYNQFFNEDGSFFKKIHLAFIKSFGFYLPVFQGRGFLQYSFGFLPKRTPITTVVGAPIKVTKIVKPTEEDINSLYEEFLQALKDLFYAHRENCGYPKAEIEII